MAGLSGMPAPSGPLAGPSGPKAGPAGLATGMPGPSGAPGPSGLAPGPSGPSFGPAVAGTPSRSFESHGTSSEKLKKRTAKSDGKAEHSSLLAPKAASASPSESLGTASFSSLEADGQHSSFETNPAANTDGTKVKKKKAKSNKQLQG
ncbi:hypothetical protein AK812_SmicGene29076 [Symbiodinium microadriaticum]|uniref:Uncharacterized protein n=1 Tax=Symbiodinium microadriaticum TaxID=2951 RepID=A0A1Q9D2V9_SYMMI|nr:hypothetical protein AK812_SmicGene29076 [Symbiodinium microadriaticum]